MVTVEALVSLSSTICSFLPSYNQLFLLLILHVYGFKSLKKKSYNHSYPWITYSMALSFYTKAIILYKSFSNLLFSLFFETYPC